MELLIGIVVALVFGAACGTIASNKGRRAVLWFILGCIFSIISLLIILVLPKKEGTRWQA